MRFVPVAQARRRASGRFPRHATTTSLGNRVHVPPSASRAGVAWVNDERRDGVCIAKIVMPRNTEGFYLSEDWGDDSNRSSGQEGSSITVRPGCVALVGPRRACPPCTQPATSSASQNVPAFEALQFGDPLSILSALECLCNSPTAA